MKVLKSFGLSPFGGLNFVLAEFESKGLGTLLNTHLPSLANQSKYQWSDIIFSLWSVLFCGGDCAEDLAINFRDSFSKNPNLKVPSPDRILERMKSLAVPKLLCSAKRGKSIHEFSLNDDLNALNIRILKRLGCLKVSNPVTLDYDNTIIFTNKEDARNTYLKQHGYNPGVGLVGHQVVYLENKNGNSDAQSLQQDTLSRMFALLKSQGIRVDKFRADSASYQLSTLSVISKNVNTFYIRARMNETLAEAIQSILEWEEVKIDDQEVFRASIDFTPFQKIAKRSNQEDLLVPCKLIVTKIKRADGQIDLFTGESCIYSTILTNDDQLSDDQVVFFYNQRGASEREFDVLKNDFGWDKMPFSRIEQNTVFLLLTAMCRNLYDFIIRTFSLRFKHLSPNFRLKKFIFRFICIPAKWIKGSRQQRLRLYGNLPLRT
jgi:hypothetical protein